MSARYATRNRVRAAVRSLLQALPSFRGKGRITLALDRLLTDPLDPDSYKTESTLNGNARFLFDLRPWGQKFAFYYGEWERPYVSVMRKIYRGGIFVDIGSSIGLYVACLGDLVGDRGGRIISVEPLPFNLDRLRQNIALNGLESIVEVVPFALDATPGKLMMAGDPLRADNNAFVADTGDLEVEVTTLDALAENWSNVSLIKLDIEGYEPRVLEGGHATIRRHRPILFAEFNRERMLIYGFQMRDTWEWFLSERYRFFVLRNGQLEALDAAGDEENIFMIPEEDASWACSAVRT